MDYYGLRYIDGQAFESEIRRLRIYRGFVGDSRLEELERCRVVIPKWRIQYPDPIARRFWVEQHPNMDLLSGDVEPDGPRLSNAIEFTNALFRWQYRRVYGRCTHPLDAADPRFAEFAHQPATRPFLPWGSFRLDVSNTDHAPLYHSGAVTVLYTSWQVLLVAEAADMGVHSFLNLADPTVARQCDEAMFGNQTLASRTLTLRNAPVPVIGDFARHERALHALVWFIEEERQALVDATRHRTGRFRLTEQEMVEYRSGRDAAAHEGAARFRISVLDIVSLGQFLGGRWAYWSDYGRPLIANEYRRYLGDLVLMVQIVGDLSYQNVRERIGRQGSYFAPILDVAWPDWVENEKARARHTLNGMKQDPTGLMVGITEQQIDGFIEFIDQHDLHSFFWRLRSCEEHVLRGNAFAVAGLQSDVQGMAVVLEHIARALAENRGTRDGGLLDFFKLLWRSHPGVLSLLKRSDISRLAYYDSNGGWAGYVMKIAQLRQGGAAEQIVADLMLARCIRGAVHGELPETDPSVLEDLFTALLRAAILTFVQVTASAGRPEVSPSPSAQITSGERGSSG